MPTYLCSKCELDHLISDPYSGEVVCGLCGLVVQDKIEVTKTGFVSRESKPCGSEPSSLAFYDMGLSTLIGDLRKDGKGQSIEPSIRSTMRRLKTWDQRVHFHDSKDRNLKQAFSLLYTLRDKFRLSDATIEKAAYIYRKAVSKRLMAGRSIDATLVAALYVAIRETRTSISLYDMSKVSNIRLKTIARLVRLLGSELEIQIPTSDPALYVTKVGNQIGLNEKTIRDGIDLMHSIREKEYSTGKKPMSLAATVLYAACVRTDISITQKEIAEASGITAVTLRTRLRDLKRKNLI